MTMLQWVRAPQQARSHETLERLLDATEALLEESADGGFDAIPVSEIVARARSSVGAFYARFPDKTALLHLLHERFCAEARATSEEALKPERWAGVSVEQLTAALGAFVAHEYKSRLGLRREIVRRNSVDPRFRERSAAVSAHSSTLFARLLIDRRDELTHEDPFRAADFAHRMMFSMLDQQVQFSDRAPALIQLTPEQLVTELIRALLAYLGVKSATATRSAPG